MVNDQGHRYKRPYHSTLLFCASNKWMLKFQLLCETNLKVWQYWIVSAETPVGRLNRAWRDQEPYLVRDIVWLLSFEDDFDSCVRSKYINSQIHLVLPSNLGGRKLVEKHLYKRTTSPFYNKLVHVSVFTLHKWVQNEADNRDIHLNKWFENSQLDYRDQVAGLQLHTLAFLFDDEFFQLWNFFFFFFL